ncbi:MAG: glycine cleavage system protein GcvH [Actinomycetota bacterium]|nr:glycine cleavage system protein GcvH [Actinomycetota bacterium]
MTELPNDRRYTRAHEWAMESDGRILVGITDYAQDQLGDVVYVDLPEAGAKVTAGEPMGEVESTKSVSDVYSPVTGTVLERNSEAEQNPEVINSDPYGGGWLVAVDAPAPALEELMGADEYRQWIEQEEEDS